MTALLCKAYIMQTQLQIPLANIKKRNTYTTEHMFATMDIDINERHRIIENKLKKQERRQETHQQLELELQHTQKITDITQLEQLTVDKLKKQLTLYKKEGMKTTPSGISLVLSKRKQELIDMLKEIIANK
jgi:hypothetical protein